MMTSAALRDRPTLEVEAAQQASSFRQPAPDYKMFRALAVAISSIVLLQRAVLPMYGLSITVPIFLGP